MDVEFKIYTLLFTSISTSLSIKFSLLIESAQQGLDVLVISSINIFSRFYTLLNKFSPIICVWCWNCFMKYWKFLYDRDNGKDTVATDPLGSTPQNWYFHIRPTFSQWRSWVDFYSEVWTLKALGRAKKKWDCCNCNMVLIFLLVLAWLTSFNKKEDKFLFVPVRWTLPAEVSRMLVSLTSHW